MEKSPRWLCQVGRLETARQAVTQLRVGATAETVETELEQIQRAIDLDIMNSTRTGWGQLFRGSDLRHTLTVVGVMSLSQANGESCTPTSVSYDLILQERLSWEITRWSISLPSVSRTSMSS